MDVTGLLFTGLLAMATGISYFVYGKRQRRYVPMVCGLLLCAIPFLIGSPVWLLLAGLALAAGPFVFRE